MRNGSNRVISFVALLGAILAMQAAVSRAETITLSLAPESFVATEGACYDPLGALGPVIRSNPELSQAYVESMGLTELPPPCDEPASGIVGLSGSIELEITPASLNGNTSVAIQSADIAADELVSLVFDLEFLGSMVTEIDGLNLGITAPAGLPQSLSEVKPDGTFSLAAQEFSIDGGIATSEMFGPLAGAFDDYPESAGPFDLSISPLPLIQAEYVKSNSLDPAELRPLDVNGILHGDPVTGPIIMYIPFSLALWIGDAAPGVFGDGFPPHANFEGMIVATGTSPFALPPSSLLTVPEPSTMVMGLSAVLLLGLWRGRIYGRRGGQFVADHEA